MYAIGAFAKLTGVTPKTLYLYERHGLIKPRRTSAGYRRYTMRELHQLSRVLALKTLGLSLQEITSLRPGSRRMTEVLQRRRAALADKKAQIDRALQAIDAIARDDQPAAALSRFLDGANWDRWEAKRRDASAGVVRAPDRASPSRLALFHEIAAALERDPSGASAVQLVTKWHELLEREADGDAETAAAKRHAWSRRQHWPDGLRQYVASLYDADPIVWERVAAFIDAAGDRSTVHSGAARRSDRPAQPSTPVSRRPR